MSTCAVLFDRPDETPPSETLADIFQQQAAFPRPVALRLAARARWFVWENAPQEPAAAVARGLSAAGFAARALPQSAVVPATAPRRVHVLKLEDGALGVQLKYTGPPQWIAWNQVLVLSAGAIKSHTTKSHSSETQLLHGERIVDTRVQVEITRAILADLIVDADGELLHLRLNCHEVNYAETIGGSIHEGWREKFSLLVARLGLRATSALISRETEALLAAGLVPDDAAINAYFASEEEFTLYNRWLATRKRLGI
jgi:hypothetical protein